jgi:MFS family permease
LFLSGMAAPVVGRLIDRRGGRFVLCAGSVLAALAMLTLAIAPNREGMVVGWLIGGLAMAACLYDPAFATLSQHARDRYRKAVTALTLFGGFASTVFWPLSHLLLEAWGWRATWAIYAGLHAFLCFPLHRLFVPSFRRESPVSDKAKPLERSPAFGDRRLIWLAASFATATFVFGVIAVHLISLLTTAGLTTAQAVTISMLVGPMQVAGRVIELGVSRRVRAVTVGLVAFALMLLALVALISVEGFGIAALLFVVAYGCGNGVLTIVKGTAPVELFGAQGLGGLLGYLSRPVFIAKAIAPAAFSAVLTLGFTRNGALSVLTGIAVLGMASYAVAVANRRREPAEPRG